MSGEAFELTEEADDIPPELDQALLDYFNVSEFGDEDCGIGGTIIDLIYDGSASDWSYFFANKTCTSKTIVYTKKKGLSQRQESFVGELYRWIVYFSDTIQFFDLNDEERMIADYIKKKHAGRIGRGVIAERIQGIIE